MFGNKDNKLGRLLKIGRILQESEDGLTQAELAREVGTSRSTLNKDLAIIQEKTGALVAEDDDGRLRWFER
ncbi:MAG TPA: HTH domain-containing protein [Chloroflexota bacterium]|nr:HTH domain-containing protein [Chloroflexota bacterium]HUM67890.1 HTH domain-containing protein [Chloroflexota bacterium]